MSAPFLNREEAGRALAARLLKMHFSQPVVVLALPRGGVPIAAIVARALRAPLDLLMVRKIGVPWQPELALAAVVDGVGQRATQSSQIDARGPPESAAA